MGCPSEDTLLAFVDHHLADTAELELHLGRCSACRRAVAALAATPDEGPARRVDTPTRIGRYVVLRFVGEGGMGRVYAAWDPVLDRKVALKLIHPLLDVPAAREQLLTEARSMARVTHPNLVAIHDAGEDEGAVFIAMEFIDGQTLREWLRTKRPEREVVEALTKAGHGLRAIHAAGLVHRDFKPGNVLVGADGRVLVTDFGLARSLRQASAGALQGGTPAYMAPEQRRGEAGDARADQFAFCVTLYEALVGRRPSLEGGVELERAGLPPRLHALLARGLATAPAARFPDLSALLERLAPPPRPSWRGPLAAATLALTTGAALLWGRPAPPCLDGPARLATAWSDPRKARLTSRFDALGAGESAAFIVRTLDALGERWVRSHRATCEATRVDGSQPDAVLALRMDCLGRRLAELDALAGVLETTGAEDVANARLAVTRLPPLEVCDDVAALSSPTPLPEAPWILDGVRAARQALTVGAAFLRTGRLDEAKATLAPLDAESRRLGWAPLRAEVLLLDGEVAAAAADFPRAEQTLRGAWRVALEAHDDRLAVAAALERAWALRELTRLPEAEEWLWQAGAMRARVADDRDLAAREASQEGHLAFAGARWADAEQSYRRALELRRQQLGAEHPETAMALADVAAALNGVERFEDSLRTAREALALLERSLGAEHPVTVQVHNTIAACLHNLHRDAEALAALDLALAAQSRNLGRGHALIARLRYTRSMVLLELERPEEALAEAVVAHALFHAAGMRLMEAESEISIAELLGERDAAAAQTARAMLASARRFLEGRFPAGHETIAVTWETEGGVELAQRRFEAAHLAYTRAIQLREQQEPASPNVAAALLGDARAARGLGRLADARRGLLRAEMLLTGAGDDPLLEEIRREFGELGR
ncbi:MAG: protein kinase domain-containing protein [Myxococcota bacterium]